MKQVRHEFSANDYKNATEDYAQTWKTIDLILYGVCSDYPLHTDRLSVTAKIVLIARTYATGIERKVSTTGTQGSALSQVVRLFFSHGKEIDQWLTQLAPLVEPLTSSNIDKILTVHGLILELLSGLTIDSQSARTFVSKYLHFHHSVVPIYDNVAAGFLPKLVRLRADQIQMAEHADKTYATYVSRFAKLYGFASQSIMVTVRLLTTI